MTPASQSSSPATDARQSLALLESAMTALAALDTAALTIALPRTRDLLGPLPLPEIVHALVTTGATTEDPAVRKAIATAAEQLGAHATASTEAALYLDPEADDAATDPAALTRAVPLDTVLTALARYTNDIRVATA